jgi:glycosyltransferase involved in cell wall biosynthesis
MPKRRLPTVTVGICAYNEAANIGFLLQDIAQQIDKKFTLEKIHLISDGSSDDTVTIAKNSGLKKLKISNLKKRNGLAKSSNYLMSQTTSDILVLLNADIRLPHREFIERIITPIAAAEFDLTSCNLVAAPAQNLLEKILINSMEIKTKVFESYKKGRNVYTCHGVARALSRPLYMKLRFPHSVGEDAYSYLFALKNKFRYFYVKNTYVIYKEPSRLKDYFNQSTRYYQSKMQFETEFGKAYLKKTYLLPKGLLLKAIFTGFIKKPTLLTLYYLLTVSRNLLKVRSLPISNQWEIATTSKHITL